MIFESVNEITKYILNDKLSERILVAVKDQIVPALRYDVIPEEVYKKVVENITCISVDIAFDAAACGINTGRHRMKDQIAQRQMREWNL